jgi:signal transduction histidine kinase
VAEVPDKVEISIADNGPGIPPDIRKRLFEPFVSEGKVNGTGLGLTIAQKILQDHGGDITLDSASAGRTVFKLAIPKPPELIPPIRDEKMSSVPTASSLT